MCRITKVNLVLAFIVMFIMAGLLAGASSSDAAVTALNAWTNIHYSSPGDNSGTINAGNVWVTSASNRLFLAAVCLETASGVSATATISMSLGGTALTTIGNTGTASAIDHCYMGYLEDSQIPSGSNSLSVTYDLSGTAVVNGIHVKWASYSGVGQGNPIKDSNANTSSAKSVTFGDQIDYVTNGLTLYVAANGGGSGCTMTAPSGFSELQSNSNNAFTSFIATTANHGSDGNYVSGTTVSFSGTTQNRSAIVVASINPPYTTVGNNDGGGEPTNKTIGPGAGAEELDAFTLSTSTGTDTVTGVTVTLQSGTYAGLSLVEITDDAGSTVYGSVSDPSSNTVSMTLGTNISVTTTTVQYKVRITPKSHADMPAPPGAQYNVTGKVTGITCTYPSGYNDSGSATISVDNQSPSNPTGVSGDQSIPGQVGLSWTNPFFDFSQVVLLRNTVAIADTPVEGTTYSQGNTIGTSTVIYVGNSNNFTDTGLTDGVPYYYKIFAKDAYDNYSSGTSAGPYTPGLVVTASSSGTQVATMNTGSTGQYVGAAFTFQQTLGTPDSISALTITETGNANANTKLTNVKVYYESDVASCSYDGTESSYSTSFNTSDKIVLSSISIPVTVSPNYTCVYVVFDVDSTAINGTTVDLEITGGSDFTLAGGTPKLGTYPLALSGTTTISGPINTFVKVGSFQSPWSGNSVVTGVGFQPQAVIFYWTRQTATGFYAFDSIGMGFAAGSPSSPDNRGVAIACNDAVNPTNCGRRRSETNSIMLLSSGNPLLGGSASVTSFDQDGFTVNWDYGPYGYYYINYIAISGSAITNVKAGTITAGTSTGDQAFTGVGFQPDFVMFLSGLTESVDTNTPDMFFNTGFMNSAGEQAAISVGGLDAKSATPHAASLQRTNMAIMGITNTGQDSLASYGSMDSDGFTLNFSDAPVADTDIFYLALKGGTFKIGSFNQATATGTQDTTIVGFQPLGLFMASFNRTASTSLAAEGEISIGAATSSTERGTIWGETRDVIASDANMSFVTNKAIRLATTATVDAEADFDSFLSNGFRLNWTTADTTPRQIVYWAIAGNSTTVGNNDGGGEPTNKSIGPGNGPEELDAFTLQTSAGTDEVTGVTVTLASGTYAGLSLVEITDNAGSTVYGSVSDPSSNTVSMTLGTNINVTTTPVQYKVRITPKSHADMPVPPGAQYSVTGKVTDITSINPNAKIYNDSGSAYIWIDNLSPSAPFSLSGVPGILGQVGLSWTNPFFDFSQVVLLRNTVAIADTPVEGTTYSQGNTIGTSTVIYVGNSNNFTDTGLTNGVPYYYKIFAKDTYGNYSSTGTAAGPYTPGLVVTASSSGTQVATMNTGSTGQYIGAAFTFQQLLGTPDSISALTITETGNANANTKLTNVKVYYESNVASCSYDGTESSYSTSFNTSDKIVLSSISIPVTVSPNYTCVYVVFDVDSTAINGTTVDLEITGGSDFTLAGGTTKDGTYPLALSGTTTISGPINTFVKVGNFKSVSSGNSVVTGVGFQPQAVIFYWTRQSTTGFSTGDSIGMGFAAGSPSSPDNRGVAIACDDNVTPTNCGRRRSETNSIMLLYTGSPSLWGSASVTSFDQDGFTVNWNSSLNGIYINYIAISGSAITNVKAGTITAGTSAGDQAFTGVGFQPDFVMFLSGLTESVDTNTPDMLFNTGFMNSAGEQAAISVCGRDGMTPVNGDGRSRQRTNYAIMGLTNTCTQDSLAKYGSMDSDGFTLNFSDGAPASDTDIFYLALQGGTHKIGSFNQATATGTQDTTIVGFQPLGLFMASFNRTASTSLAAEGEISIGAATSSTERGTIWGENRDVPSGYSDANMSVMTNKAIRLATTATVDAEADFDSFLSNGFRLNWTTADTTPRQIVYWAIASNSIIVGNNDGGGEPTGKSIGPGNGPEELDAFTLQTSAGTDEVTGVTVTLASGTYAGLGLVEITDNAGSTVYGSVSDPTTNDVSITLGTNINVTTTPVQYKVRITPKSHADMPVPPGAQYYVTGKVTEITSINPNAKIYNDSGSSYIWIDNLSPSAPFSLSGNASEGQVVLNWTLTFSPVVLLRNTSAITDTPTEGVTYSQGNTIGTSTVIFVTSGGSSNTFTDTGLTDGVTYYYKIFALDTYANYSATGTAAGPYIPGPVVTASSQGTQKISMEAGTTSQYIGAAFTFQQSSGIADTVNALTISDTGTAVANTMLNNVKVYWESGVSSCSSPPTSNSIDTSFDASDKIVLSSISIPVTVSPNYTCVYVVFDVNMLAINGTTVDPRITSSADFTIAVGSNKILSSYPSALALPGTTTLVDTTAPGNITNLTVSPSDKQVTLNWTNPTDADFVGVRISRNEGIGESPPADCSSGTWSINVPAPATNYTNTGLTNGKPYFYRICSYDEIPNYSTGETISAIPSVAPVLSFPEAPYDDGKDPDTGNTTTDFTFKVIYSDWQNDPPDFASGYPKIYIGDNDGYMTGYTMSLDTSAPASLHDGNYSDGEQYVYGPIGLGAAEDLRFYFKAKAASGDLSDVYLPLDVLSGGYIVGPSVCLLPGYNIVGVPKDLGTGQPYNSVLGDDSGYIYCVYWDSYGLDIAQDVFSGDYLYCTYGNIVQGTAQYIYALSGDPKKLDEPTGVGNVTAASVDIALDPDGGWTMISNPYNARIKLEDVKVVKDSIEYTFSQAVTNEWIDNAIYEWEGSISGFTSKAYNGSPPAVLDPWVGFYLYVKDTTAPIILRVYEPAP